MAYFVTGATGFIGRHLVEELVDHREGDDLRPRPRGLAARLEDPDRAAGAPRRGRVVPVVGDLSQRRPRRRPDDGSSALQGQIDALLPPRRDLRHDGRRRQRSATPTSAAPATRSSSPSALEAGRFHHRRSVAAAGDYHGSFGEDMFDEAQHLPSPYHRTKYESERIVREECERAVAGLPARRSWSATPRPARWTRSTAPTTSSR